MRSSILSLLLLAGVTLADFSNVTTVTNYITPVCFQSALSEILPAELGAPQSTGIKVVFVYEEAGALAASESDSNPHATNVVGASYTTSDLTYTIRTSSVATATITTCTDGYCSVYQSQSTIPTSYEMSTKVTYLTTFTGEGTETKTTEIPKISSTKSNTSGESSTTTSPEATTKPSTITEKSSSKENTSTVTKKERSTIYETDKITQDLTTTVKITKSAPTTTTTLFSASTIISYNNNTVTTSETITQTASDPLITKSAVPTSKNVTIAVDSITKAVSFTTSSAPSNSSITTKLFSNSSVASVSPSSTHSTATLETYLASNVSSHVNSTSFAGYNTSSSILPVSYSTIISNSSTIVSTFLAASTESIAATTTTLESSAESETATTLVTSETLSSSSSKTSTSTSASTSASAAASDTSSSNGYTGDLFTAISTESPPSVFSRADLPLAIPSGVSTESPIGTNKFYANLFLGAQTDMVWTAPYGGFWKTSDYYGFAVQHTDPDSRVFGTSNTNNEDVYSYYLNPTNLGELIISSTTLSSSSNNMFVTNMNEMSATVQLTSDSTLGSNYIEIPLVQGMGFVTSIYHGSTTAVINSLVGVKTLTQETSSALNANTLKFRATLESGNDWLIYVTDPSKSKTKRAFKRSFDFSFDASNPYKLIGSSSIDGLIIQYAFAPSDLTKDAYYDEAAGCYATSASVTGSVSLGTSATYLFKYTVSGSSSSGKTIVFALPHHVASVTSTTANANTGITLYSTTKGEMVGFLTNELSFAEELTTDIQFLPWSLMMTGSISYTADQLKLLAEAANDELSVDISLTVAGMDSNYFSGKVIDKYAYILLVVNDIIGDETVAKSTLADLKEAFAPFIANKQYYPLMYDTRWLGVTSTASQNGDTGADYGSGYYNDHHFHYGYFVHAAAVVGYIDKKYGGTWAEDNKDWVNSLIRDVANPSSDDTYFPVSRMFDWFGGHSWAAGLFASGDGKNQESSSEDYNFSYGMKLWGKVIGDEAMESRGDLMLAIQKRAMNLYMYYTDDNTVEPSGFIGNKVSGILYENKIAYTTFFGSPDVHPEYVHGIHMMPITPASSLIRGPTYVKQEWTDQVSTFINNVDSGWTGVLKLNQALYDASTSYEFFSSDSWTDTYLDNGQSRTWALAYSGGIQNAT